jgi:hypothetical protein
MTDALLHAALAIIIPSVVVLALTVDVSAAIGWLRSRWR